MDWKALADVLGVPLTDEDLALVVSPLDRMQQAFEPLRASVPLDEPMWTSAEASE
jgi:hypothetical protein